MAVARLDTIRRQRDPELREAVTHSPPEAKFWQPSRYLSAAATSAKSPTLEQRRKQIAREYAAAHHAGERVLVVSPANEERRELNKAIRAELSRTATSRQPGTQHTILVNRGLSGAQRAIAYNYEEGDVIRFTRGSKQFAIPKGSYARVEAVDREANMLTVKTPDGRVASNTIRSGSSASKSSARSSGVLARGERIQFRLAGPRPRRRQRRVRDHQID